MPDVNEQFTARYQRAWTEEDVVELNRLFEKHLFASLENYTDPIPGVIPTLEKAGVVFLFAGMVTAVQLNTGQQRSALVAELFYNAVF